MTRDYDLLVIGAGPAGRSAAIEAASLGRRVALVERDALTGGSSGNSSALLPAALRAANGVEELDELRWRARDAATRESSAVSARLRSHGVVSFSGSASFADPHTLEIAGTYSVRLVTADRIVVAVGTRPARPRHVPFDGRTVIDPDWLDRLARPPISATVVGGGVVGLECASILAALGTRVAVVDPREGLLPFADDDVVAALQAELETRGAHFCVDRVVGVERRRPGDVVARLASGEDMPAELVVWAAGREGATGALRLHAAGLAADASGRVAVDASFRTTQPHVFAVGSVIGSRGLAATSVEQGRLAAAAACGVAAAPAALLPYAIHTIPQISFVGRTETELAAARVPYVVGTAREAGLLKLLVNRDTRALEGVHVLGGGATEIVGVGRTAIAAGLAVDYLADPTFASPTFSHAFRLAALAAKHRLDALGRPLQRKAANA